jgi:ATP-dependent helicase/nuclease subunit B
MKDLAMIYAAYEKELGEENFDAYDELMFTAENIAKNNFFKGKSLYFDGFSGFTYAEFEIIAAAISQADDVCISLEIPEIEVEDEENGIFNKGFDTKNRIIALAERAGCEYEEEHLKREEREALSFLDRSLYSPLVRVYEGDASEICIARADGSFAECELCAAYILDGVREKGMRFRDYSIAVTSGDEYIHTCRMVFSRYGIPAYSTKPTSLISKPAVAIILAAFECIVRGFGVNQVMEYIKTGFAGIRSRSLDIFENYLYTWSPRASMWSGGREFTKNPLGLGYEETEKSRELLRVVNCVRKKIYEPIDELRRAMQKGKTGEKCKVTNCIICGPPPN